MFMRNLVSKHLIVVAVVIRPPKSVGGQAQIAHGKFQSVLGYQRHLACFDMLVFKSI